MAGAVCPKCGARVAPTDLQCLDCGVDLVEERRKAREALQDQSLIGRKGDQSAVVPRNAAAGGRALPGEKSKETRLKVFDQHHAKMIAEEAKVALAIGIPTLLVGLGLLGWGLARMKAVGFGEIVALRPVDLRELGAFADPRLLAVIIVGLGLSSLLVGVGMFLRWNQARAAIRDVQAGEKPEIVGMNSVLLSGLLVLGIFLAPVGLVLGLLLRLSKDSDLAGFGGTLFKVSLIVIVVLLANFGIGLIAGAVGGSGAAATGGAKP